MRNFKLDRRTFLRGVGAGGVAIALPTLDAMLNDRGLLHGTARADGVKFPVRLVTFYIPNGTHMERWVSKGEGKSWTPSACMEPLVTRGVKGDVNVLVNLTHHGISKHPQPGRGGDHARGTSTFAVGFPPTLVGAGGPSIDQIAAAAMGRTTRFGSLPIANQGPGGSDSLTSAHTSNISWIAKDQPAPAERDPGTLFERLFGKAETADAAREAKYRKSVLDFVRGDIGRLNGALGAGDRVRLEAHLSGIRDLERAVGPLPAACVPPEAPDSDAGKLPQNERAQPMMRLLVMALQCDLTRFASFMLGNAGAGNSFPWLGLSKGHHQMSHDFDPDEIEKYTIYEVDQFAYLCELMKAVPEGTGTLLDNSLVFFSSEIANGKAHNHDNLPILLGGRGGGQVVTGRRLVYKPGRTDGTPLNNLFAALLSYAGVPTTKFGLNGTEALTGLSV